MEHGETFYGMSSMNEYWNSSSETYSDDSLDESQSDIKEYRDASCNVDFDEEFDEIKIPEDKLVIERNSRKSIDLTDSRIEKKVDSKLSRYVRWDVLMSLGIGLWAVLCIVDLLHSEESVTRDWLYESVEEKKNVSKIVSIKKPASHTWSFFNSWPYIWKIISISSLSGAYILLFILLIVFCADPRLRKNSGQTSTKSNSKSNISPAKIVEESIDRNEIIKINRSKKLLQTVKPVARKVISVKLETRPAIYLHARILSSIEEHAPRNFGARHGVSRSTPKIVHASSQTICRRCFNINQKLVTQLDIPTYERFKYTNIRSLDHFFIANNSSVLSRCLIYSNNTTCAVRTFHLTIEEHQRKRKKYSTDVFIESFANVRGIDTIGESSGLSKNLETEKRIITSSPVFKKFLSRLKHKKTDSCEIATRTQTFRSHIQDI